ncbi:MAG: hypothetical protein AB7C90_03330 [Bacteroidales bacterium]
MDTEFYIDRMIEREKGQQPDPFLSTRVMARIAPAASGYRFWLRGSLAALSLAVVLLSGIHLGRSLADSQETRLPIDDTTIENLDFYYLLSHEE